MSNDVRDAFNYDPHTGVFTWKENAHPYRPAGKVAGGKTNRGYWVLKFKNRTYQAGPTAFYIMTGEWPDRLIDHINCDPLDNRWCNLRLATPEQNNANVRKIGKSGLPKGVALHRTGKYQACFRAKYLGLFLTKEEAHEAYIDAAKQRWGEFARAS